MSTIRVSANKFNKDELTKVMHLTCPPRMEGKVKNAMMNAIHKPKQVIEQKSQTSDNSSSKNSTQQKDYQLKSPKRKG